MDCPVCKEAMIVLELNEVEIDHCPACSGIWLDSGELEMLLDSEKEKDIVLNSFKTDKRSKEKKRKCPICMKKMEKILYENKNIILIDKCSLNHGLWFDQGELKKIVEIVNLDKNNKITLLLDDIFGMKNREVES